MAEKTWIIPGPNGTQRQVTLAEFRAEIEARKALARPVMDAWRRGDAAGVAAAQRAMRAKFAAA